MLSLPNSGINAVMPLILCLERSVFEIKITLNLSKMQVL